MGKASRGKKTDKISVFDAAEVVDMADEVAARITLPGFARAPEPVQQGSRIMPLLQDQWRKHGRITLRIDDDFAHALAGSDTDIELTPDWIDRLPYGAFMGSLARPLTLHDGIAESRYHGFYVSGIVTAPPQGDRVFTVYRPFAGADGFRFVWLFRDEDNNAGAQTLSWHLRGPHAKDDVHTLTDLVTRKQQSAARERTNIDGRSVYQSTGTEQPHGLELPVLLPLSIQLLLYMAATEPDDLETIPPARTKRPQQLVDAQVINVGWRVGAALRANAKRAGTGLRGPGGGWQLPPHMRKAHYARRRYATRDEQGRIVGDRLGEYGTDWYYDTVWIAPTSVNVTPDTPPDPVVRRLA